MATIAKTILISGATAILTFAGMASTVDARDGQRSNAQKNFSGGERAGKNHTPRLGKIYRDRNYDRSSRRALRGVFILGEGRTSACSYEYRKWQVTGSRYWRSRYRNCRSG